MDLSLHGRRALVCGSTQGIGRGTAVEIASLGAQVTLLARDEDRLRRVAGELPSQHGQSHDWVAADFTHPQGVADAIAAKIDPARPYHILVNNTGGPRGGPAHAAEPEEFLGAFQAHIIAAHLLVRLLLPGFKAARYGRIINIISTSAKAPIPDLGVSNTIRAAVAGWAKTLAGELGPLGITVNNVLPGFTDTARLGELFGARARKTGQSLDDVRRQAISGIPAGRLARPEEIGAAVAFLATPAAAYINGINLPVDGGRTPCL